MEIGRVERLGDSALDRSEKFGKEGLTFDDVLLVPAESAVLPNDVSTATRLTRTIALEIPIVSAAMDTVTEARMAIALAREGGIGIIHRNLSIADQIAEVDKVKRSESGMIVEPLTLPPDALVADALELMERYHVSGVPITEAGGRLVGILTNRDLRFEKNLRQPVSALMTSEGLVTAPAGTTLAEAEELLHRHRIEKLPVVDADGIITGLITVKDIQKRIEFPAVDQGSAGPATRRRRRRGRPRCDRAGRGARRRRRRRARRRHGSRTFARRDRDGRPDQGHLRRLRGRRGQHRHGGGGRGTDRRGRRRGQGRDRPGTICTTRIVAGVGVPQITAIHDVSEVCARHGVPVIGDGGIKSSGDIGKALAAGADTVMLGSMLAGTDEAPGDVVFAQGERYKEYRAMGSLGAMRARGFSKDRYFQGDVEDVDKLVPEGIEARVPYKGAISAVLYQLVGGLRASMGYCGAPTVEALKEARFVRITGAGLRESHPHDITITKDAPNYRRS